LRLSDRWRCVRHSGRLWLDRSKGQPRQRARVRRCLSQRDQGPDICHRSYRYAWNRVLGYVKGGVAWERDNYSASTILVGTAYTASHTRPGWTIGAGGEYAINKFLSGFVEYDYYDFGTSEIRFAPRLVGLRPGFLDIEETASVVRAGLNLRFGG
jgi:hypothetical protein